VKFRNKWGVYLSGTVVTQVVSLGAAILTRRFLGPVQIGIWTLMQLILSYTRYSSLGTMAASSLEIPFYVGKKTASKSPQYKKSYVLFCHVWNRTVIYRTHYRRLKFAI